MVGLCKQHSSSSFEDIKKSMTTGKQTIQLMGVYRPPSSARNKLTTSLISLPIFFLVTTFHLRMYLLVVTNFQMDKPNDPDTH